MLTKGKINFGVRYWLSRIAMFLLFLSPPQSQIQAENLHQSQNAEAVRIVIEFGFSGYKITKFYYSQAQKTLEVGKNVLVERAIYGRLLNQFKDGVLDLNDDNLYGAPRWNGAMATHLIKSELTFQWSMAHFLESRGIKDNRLLNMQKERLFAEQEAFERCSRIYSRCNMESMFTNMRSLRRAFVNLRRQVR